MIHKHPRITASVVLALATCAATIALIAAFDGPASGTTTSSHPRSRVIHLIATEDNNQVLNLGKGSGLGDEVVFSGTVQHPGSNGTIGSFGGTLIQITSGGLQQANLTIQLPEGQIAVQGVLDFAKPPYVHAITGGTGAYHGLGGEFTFTELGNNVLAMTLTLDH